MTRFIQEVGINSLILGIPSENSDSQKFLGHHHINFIYLFAGGKQLFDSYQTYIESD